MYCSKCGAQIADGSRFCPECGQAIENQTAGMSGQYSQPNQHFDYRQNHYQYEQDSKMNPLALAGFIVGCVSVFINFWGIVGGTALGLSIAGLFQINGGKGAGKGFAITGIILGAIGVLFGLLVLAGISILF